MNVWWGLLEVKGMFEWLISPSMMLKIQNRLLNINYYISRAKDASFKQICSLIYSHTQVTLSRSWAACQIANSQSPLMVSIVLHQ